MKTAPVRPHGDLKFGAIGKLLFGLCLTSLGNFHGTVASASPDDRALAKSVPCEAVVQKFEPSAMWDHTADGGFAAYDAVRLKIVLPAERKGQEVRVFFESGSIDGTSFLGKPDSRYRFGFDFAQLKQNQLFRGVLENLELVAANGSISPERMMRPADASVLANVVGELGRLDTAAKEEKPADGFPPSRQTAYYLIAGLAMQGVVMSDLPEAEQRTFEIDPRGGTRTKLVSVFSDVRVALLDGWIQDKAGSYVLRQAVLYIQQEGKWVEKGSGTVAASDLPEP